MWWVDGGWVGAGCITLHVQVSISHIESKARPLKFELCSKLVNVLDSQRSVLCTVVLSVFKISRFGQQSTQSPPCILCSGGVVESTVSHQMMLSPTNKGSPSSGPWAGADQTSDQEENCESIPSHLPNLTPLTPSHILNRTHWKEHYALHLN